MTEHESVALIAHSRTIRGHEAMTFALCYERFIHPQFLTHRWSRNAGSSRAIPQARLAQWIKDDPAIPAEFGRKAKGMKSSGQGVERPERVRALIDRHREFSLETAALLDAEGLHKEWCNRYAEAHGHIRVVATMGRPQLMNFFHLRIVHPDRSKVASNMTRLAVRMARAVQRSTPRLLLPGEWHLPFVGDEQRSTRSTEDLIARSVAACGWTSYQTVDGRDSTSEDERRMHDMLVAEAHSSPLEHQLQARGDDGMNGLVPGYDSYRSMVPGESSSTFDWALLEHYADV